MNIKEVPCVAYITSPAPESMQGRFVDVHFFGGIGIDGPKWYCHSEYPLGCYESDNPVCDLFIPDFVLRQVSGTPINMDINEIESCQIIPVNIE